MRVNDWFKCIAGSGLKMHTSRHTNTLLTMANEVTRRTVTSCIPGSSSCPATQCLTPFYTLFLIVGWLLFASFSCFFPLFLRLVPFSPLLPFFFSFSFFPFLVFSSASHPPIFVPTPSFIFCPFSFFPLPSFVSPLSPLLALRPSLPL